MTIQLAGAFWILPLVVALLAVSGGLILSRLLRGPTGADRVVAIDAMTLLGVASIVTVSLITGQSIFLDVAVVLALVSFLGTVGFALLFRKDREVDDTGMNPEEDK
ncbi:MAG: pH regulation protein F [Azoarcus sp.]|nr:pH regulation protein F [Azoarcus sp.]|tara:strand:- start:1214 stop:1531 length:318 start_codon:yes stop_codon:yes gene_type:complete